ncbi:MAG TPA: YiaA/YiaB family inner membrane protein [Burkholderiaceae bacterium]|nr:YiaA/YiaB family inner membrane protein [Burkholderiaceae bacterium]
MSQRYLLRHDTQAWKMQVWLSFGVSVLLVGIGVLSLPSSSTEAALLALGCFFVLSSAFGVAKTVRDNQHEKVDTQAWIVQVWAAFIIAVLLTAWGILTIKVEVWHRWYLIASSLFMLSSTFTLAKTVRDNHDIELLEQAQRRGQSEAART